MSLRVYENGMIAHMTRRAFLWLTGMAGLGVLGTAPYPIRRRVQTRLQRTLDAVIGILLPGGGDHGTRNDEPGAIDSRLYGQTIGDHLMGEYFLSRASQAALDQGMGQLDSASLCLGFLTPGFVNLSEQKQSALLALVTRRVDEGDPSYLSPLEVLCLRLAGAEGRGQQLVDLGRLAGAIFYTSDPGLPWLKQSGYPGPNWGFNPSKGWGPIPPPDMA